MGEFIKAKQTEPDGAQISEQRILQDKIALKANTRCMQIDVGNGQELRKRGHSHLQFNNY
jgi:hypothetical protein